MCCLRSCGHVDMRCAVIVSVFLILLPGSEWLQFPGTSSYQYTLLQSIIIYTILSIDCTRSSGTVVAALKTLIFSQLPAWKTYFPRARCPADIQLSWGVAFLPHGAPKITAVVHLQSCRENGLLLLTSYCMRVCRKSSRLLAVRLPPAWNHVNQRASSSLSLSQRCRLDYMSERFSTWEATRGHNNFCSTQKPQNWTRQSHQQPQQNTAAIWDVVQHHHSFRSTAVVQGGRSRGGCLSLPKKIKNRPPAAVWWLRFRRFRDMLVFLLQWHVFGRRLRRRWPRGRRATVPGILKTISRVKDALEKKTCASSKRGLLYLFWL